MEDLLLMLLVMVVAFLYSSVGHAGASGYIAVFVLWGMNAGEVKSFALILNIVVATIAFVMFYRAGYFSWRLFWPFAVGSVPMAFYGGQWGAGGVLLEVILGGLLILSAFKFIFEKHHEDVEVEKISVGLGVVVGGLLGFLAGLTGTGGGILLTPLMLMMRWGKMKQVSAVSAAFIGVNSVSGLIGYWNDVKVEGQPLLGMIAAVIVGGMVGSSCGCFCFQVRTIKVILSGVLMLAGFKLGMKNWV
jgi:hypothetical protein